MAEKVELVGKDLKADFINFINVLQYIEKVCT